MADLITSLSQQPDTGPELRERVRLLRDGVVNNLGFVVSGVVGLILIPMLLGSLGAELYGLWIAAQAVAGLAAIFDPGLNWSVTREVGAVGSGEVPEETARFVRTSATAYLLIGALGALVVGCLGLVMRDRLHLSPESQKIALAVFALTGLSFLFTQLVAFAQSVLGGLRRFDAINLIQVSSDLLRAAGIIALLRWGQGLVWVVGWQVLVGSVTALAALAMIGRLHPGLQIRPTRLHWPVLRAHLPFSLTSQLTTGAQWVLWDAAPVLIGLVRGSAWIVPYHVGLKFPATVTGITWRVAEVFFPPASEQSRKQGLTGTWNLIHTGTRWTVVLALPLCLTLAILAPNLLRAWLGEVPPGASLILRVSSAAVLAGAVGVSALQVLWGRGAVRIILAVAGKAAAINLALSLVLLIRIGVAGPAWAFLVSMVFSSAALLRAASRLCAVAPGKLLLDVAQGLPLPVMMCVAMASTMIYLTPGGQWPGVILAAAAAGCAYALTLYRFGAREEERLLVREVVGVPAILSRSALHGFRGRLSAVVAFLRKRL